MNMYVCRNRCVWYSVYVTVRMIRQSYWRKQLTKDKRFLTTRNIDNECKRIIIRYASIAWKSSSRAVVVIIVWKTSKQHHCRQNNRKRRFVDEPKINDFFFYLSSYLLYNRWVMLLLNLLVYER